MPSCAPQLRRDRSQQLPPCSTNASYSRFLDARKASPSQTLGL